MSGEMKSDYETDAAWAQTHMPEIKEILTEHAGLLTTIKDASHEEDTTRATDLVLSIDTGAVAIRTRRSNVRYRDLTLRSWRRSGAKTEVTKIQEGHCRWYLYCWTRLDGSIESWILVDLDILRASGLLEQERREIPNTNDGGATRFIALSVQELKRAGCLTAYHVPTAGLIIPKPPSQPTPAPQPPSQPTPAPSYKQLLLFDRGI